MGIGSEAKPELYQQTPQQEAKAGRRSHAMEVAVPGQWQHWGLGAVEHGGSLTAWFCMLALPCTKEMPGRETLLTPISGCSQRVAPWARTGGLGLLPVLARLGWAATRTIPLLILTGALSLPWV